MKHIELLDCTLRDGGYLNQWKFEKRNIRTILSSLQEARIDVVECGFLTDCKYNEKYTLYPDTVYIDNLFPEKDNLPFLVAMIAIGEKEIHPDRLAPADQSIVSGIRLTFHLDEQEKGFEWGQLLMEKGYKVFMQPVGSANYSDEELLGLIQRINQMKPYAFYLVDTLGTMYQRDIRRLLYLVDNNLEPDICLGLHSHNNMQMSFANAQELIHFETGRHIFIDCCIYGMGRGAGNLCTELLAGYLNEMEPGKYETLPLIECIDRCLMYFYSKYPWGYSAAYYLASSYHCHPNYAAFLLAKQKLSVCDIAQMLQKLPPESRLVFHKDEIVKLYEKTINYKVDDRKERERLHKELRDEKIVILGSGLSIKKERKWLADYLKKNNCYVIGVNGCPKGIPVDMVFIGNEKRYQQISHKIDWKATVFTSNVRNLPKQARVVNAKDLENSSFDASDNAGLMLLNLLVKLGIRKAEIAGFDGYRGNAALNYADLRLVGSVESLEYRNKNEAASKELNHLAKQMDITFLTATRYHVSKARKVILHE